MFWEIDRDSMQAYLDEHPEALWNGWTGIDINESGLNQSGTTIKTIFGEQVLANQLPGEDSSGACGRGGLPRRSCRREGSGTAGA